MNDAGAPHKIIDPQPAEEPPGAARGQHVARAGHEVTEGRRGKITDHDRAGGRDVGGQFLRRGIGDEEFEVLRRDGVRNLRGVGEMLDLDGEETGIQYALRFFPPRDQRLLVAELHGDRLDDFSRSREQVDFLPTGTVLRLREQISRRKGRVGGVIGNDHHLARTR